MKPKLDFSLATSKQIITFLSSQLVNLRLARNWTQAQLANEAGVSLKTITNLESGKSGTLDTFIRVIKALNLQANLINLLPDATVRPMERTQLTGSERKRSRKDREKDEVAPWVWGDERQGKK